MFSASACGKVILFGEHAVVYGRPAIAVPVSGVRARADVAAAPAGAGVRIVAADLGRAVALAEADADDALALIVRQTLRRLSCRLDSDLTITVRSELPMARGLGSGAAVSAAIVRALAAWAGRPLDAETVSALVFEAERIYHGTPGGVDNTVIAYEQPVYFVKGRPPQVIAVGRPLTLLVGDTGIASSTRQAVEEVRRAWQAAPQRYEALFDQCGRIADAGRQALEAGDRPRLGALMVENQTALREIGVSSPELERLIEAALGAGALGAKLCGAGRGGNMIALVQEEMAGAVEAALRRAGAAGVITTRVAERTGQP